MASDRDDDDQGLSGLVAKLQLSLSGATDQMRRVADLHERDLARRATSDPVRRPGAQNGTVVAGTALVLDLGGPSQGRTWIIRSMKVCDAGGPRVAIAGSTFADWYIGKAVGLGAPPSSDWVWTQQGLPAVTTFTSDPQYVTPADHLYCVVTGATTAGQQLAAFADIWDGEQHYGRVSRDI